MQAKIIGKMVEQCMSNHNVVKFWSLGLDKITPRVARVSKIIVRVGSGWPKRPRVRSNLRSQLFPKIFKKSRKGSASVSQSGKEALGD